MMNMDILLTDEVPSAEDRRIITKEIGKFRNALRKIFGGVCRTDFDTIREKLTRHKLGLMVATNLLIMDQTQDMFARIIDFLGDGGNRESITPEAAEWLAWEHGGDVHFTCDSQLGGGGVARKLSKRHKNRSRARSRSRSSKSKPKTKTKSRKHRRGGR
jgi:hypothetical protein